jgi:hypothetical protein
MNATQRPSVPGFSGLTDRYLWTRGLLIAVAVAGVAPLLLLALSPPQPLQAVLGLLLLLAPGYCAAVACRVEGRLLFVGVAVSVSLAVCVAIALLLLYSGFWGDGAPVTVVTGNVTIALAWLAARNP